MCLDLYNYVVCDSYWMASGQASKQQTILMHCLFKPVGQYYNYTWNISSHAGVTSQRSWNRSHSVYFNVYVLCCVEKTEDNLERHFQVSYCYYCTVLYITLYITLYNPVLYIVYMYLCCDWICQNESQTCIEPTFLGHLLYSRKFSLSDY